MSKEGRRMSQKEQADIINQSGVMKLIPAENDSVLLTSSLLTMPLLILNISFEYLVHVQFGITDQFVFDVYKHLPLLPAIFVLTVVTSKFKQSKFGQFLFLLASSCIGCYVISLVKDDGTFGAMSKTPGLITVGVLLIIQQDLSLALLSILFWVAFYYRKLIYQFIPVGSMPALFSDYDL